MREVRPAQRQKQLSLQISVAGLGRGWVRDDREVSGGDLQPRSLAENLPKAALDLVSDHGAPDLLATDGGSPQRIARAAGQRHERKEAAPVTAPLTEETLEIPLTANPRERAQGRSRFRAGA